MHRALYTILALLIIAPLASAEQNIIASKGIAEDNTLPRIAVSDTGDFVVSWTQIYHVGGQGGNDTRIRVWYRYFKRGNGGVYSAKPATMVTNSSNYVFNSHAVYIPWKKKFLLVWDEIVPDELEQEVEVTRIMGRLIKTNGKLKGAAFTIVENDAYNILPRLAVINPPAGAPTTERSVLLVYTAFPSKKDPDGNGLIAQSLHQKKFRPVGSPQMLLPIRVTDMAKFKTAENFLEFTEGYALTTDIVAERKWYVISYFIRPPLVDEFAPAAGIQEFPYQAHFAWVRVENGKKGKLDFDRNSDVYVANQAGDGVLNERPRPENASEFSDAVNFLYGDRSKKNVTFGTLVPSFNGQPSEGALKTYTENGSQHSGTPKGGYPLILSGQFSHGMNADLQPQQSAAPAVNETYGYYVYSRGNSLRTQALSMTGDGKIQLSGNEVTRVTHGGTLVNMSTEAVVGYGTFVIAWSRALNFDDAEIRVHIYTHDD